VLGGEKLGDQLTSYVNLDNLGWKPILQQLEKTEWKYQAEHLLPFLPFIWSHVDHHNTKWWSYHHMMIIVIPNDHHSTIWWSSYHQNPVWHLKILIILHILCISSICFNCQNASLTVQIYAATQLIIICTKIQNPLNILCAINVVSSQICCKNWSTLFAQQLHKCPLVTFCYNGCYKSGMDLTSLIALSIFSKWFENTCHALVTQQRQSSLDFQPMHSMHPVFDIST
jgi:hypothetical protein